MQNTLRDSLLANAQWYHRWRQLLKADDVVRTWVEEYLRPESGDRVLDVGCGDGQVRPLLGDVEYLGIDLNEDYLSVAAARADGRTHFLHADVADLPKMNLGPFDLVIGVGLLHHLSDDSADSLLRGVRDVLVPGGRLVTLDPVFHPEQQTVARVLAALDRGRFVRDQGGYERLIAAHLAIKRVEARHDLAWFPYSHCVVEAVRPAGVS